MVITPFIIDILQKLARYYVLTRMHLQDLCMKAGVDAGGRRMRKVLTSLRHEGLVAQTEGRVVFPERNGAPAPVYTLTRKAAELLADVHKDVTYLAACTRTPDWQHLYHWIRISEFHILLDRAVALQAEVSVENFVTEWSVANPQETEPHKRYSLFTLLDDSPRLVCAPDACFTLSYRGFMKGVYLEIDRATSGVNAIAASKTKGYARMAETRGHARHFLGVDPEIPFTVLHVSPSAFRRDRVAKAIAEKPGAALWKFASWDELRPETALHEEILRDAGLKALPLVRRMGGQEQ